MQFLHGGMLLIVLLLAAKGEETMERIAQRLDAVFVSKWKTNKLFLSLKERFAQSSSHKLCTRSSGKILWRAVVRGDSQL